MSLALTMPRSIDRSATMGQAWDGTEVSPPYPRENHFSFSRKGWTPSLASFFPFPRASWRKPNTRRSVIRNVSLLCFSHFYTINPYLLFGKNGRVAKVFVSRCWKAASDFSNPSTRAKLAKNYSRPSSSLSRIPESFNDSDEDGSINLNDAASVHALPMLNRIHLDGRRGHRNLEIRIRITTG